MVSALWIVAKVSAVGAVLLLAFALLPDAPAGLDTFEIPSVVWDPLTGFLHLDRYFPLSTLIAIASVSLTIRVGMFGLWLYSWIAKHVFGGG